MLFFMICLRYTAPHFKNEICSNENFKWKPPIVFFSSGVVAKNKQKRATTGWNTGNEGQCSIWSLMFYPNASLYRKIISQTARRKGDQLCSHSDISVIFIKADSAEKKKADALFFQQKKNQCNSSDLPSDIGIQRSRSH